MITGIFRGMPVGGSMSGTSLNKTAGARSRLSLMIAGVVMAVVILAFVGPVGHLAKLVIVSASDRIREQLRVTGITDLIGPDNIYPGDERVGATLKRAYAGARQYGYKTTSAPPELTLSLPDGNLGSSKLFLCFLLLAGEAPVDEEPSH